MRRAIPRILVTAALLVGACAVVPAFASTEDELDAAKAQLEGAKGRLTDVAAALNEAESAYARVQDQVEATEARIDEISERLDALRALLEERAVEAFTGGGSSAELGALLASDSFADFSDRLEFVDSIVQEDADIAAAAEISRVELTRAEDRLADLAEARRREAENLKAQQAAIANELARLEGLVGDLQEKFEREQQALRELQLAQPSGDGSSGDGGGTPAPDGSGAIRVCPVNGPNSFVDSFGAPRSGGRSHAGQDLIAPYGTPVVAVNDGNAVRSVNSLGGNSVLLYHSGGDYTYYAHMSRYGASGNVSTGTVIGYVGSTGNAGSINHLHFEYHPGGGAAVNPYSMLTAVC